MFEPSFVRKIDKNSQFWHLFILQIHVIHYVVIAFYTIDQNINTRNHVLLMQEYLESIYKKEKKRKKMKKWQIKNLEKLEILEKLLQVFLFPSFRFCPTAKLENSDLKGRKKFPRFPIFRPGH